MTTLLQKIFLSIICITSASLLAIGSSNAQSIKKVRKTNVARPVTADVPTEPNASPPSCFQPNPLRGLFTKNQVYGVFKHQGWLYVPFVADRESTYILRIHSADIPQNNEDINILREINGQPIQPLRAADAKGDSLVFWTKDQRLVLQDETWRIMPNPQSEPYGYHGSGKAGTEAGVDFIKFWVPQAWVRQWIAEPSPGHRLLIWGERISLHSHRGPDRPGIAVLTTQTVNKVREPGDEPPMFHPLPQPSQQLYKKLVTNHRGSRYQPDLKADFGAYDVHEGDIWFGLTFYDSEGLSGVGGYGRFDPATGEYDITWGKPAADLSVLALYHAGDALWMGLTSRYESTEDPSLYQGGIARINLSNGSVRRYQVPGAVDVLCPVEETLWIGTREGLFRMKDDTVEPVWPLRDGG